MIEKLSYLFQEALRLISNAIYGVFQDTLTPFVIPVINLYLVVIGIKIILGEEETSKKNLIRLFLIFPIIMMIVMDYGMYRDYIMNPIMIIRDFTVTYITAIANEGSTNNIIALDTIFLSMKDTVYNGFEFSWTDWNIVDLILSVATLLELGLLYLAIGTFHIISFVVPGLFLTAGPIPLALFAFDKTKHIFSSWLRSTITYALYGPISAIMMIFIYYVTKVSAASISTDFDGMFFVILALAVLLFLTRMIPEFANGIMSSLTSDGGGMGSQITPGMNMGRGLKSGAMNSVNAAKKSNELYSKFRK
ncbi:type IV secretion system protein [Sulfurimonas sp.]|uniref:type IV secretion system protein n=1 Tax=Sulfurimonas sp. TaxID=2022749 RepID=UPI002AB275BA|nr:type IV secretion system protein [Sulfurimonas sp.]